MWLLAFAACAGRAPDLTPRDGRLPACPVSPNCVGSEPGEDAVHAVDPLPLPPGRTAPEVVDALVALLAEEPRAEVLRRDAAFLHAAFRTPTLRFVDDVAFRVDLDQGVVHVRSASRLGHGDLGVNRRRVEGLRARWVAQLPAAP